jgi:hypothetical protein
MAQPWRTKAQQPSGRKASSEKGSNMGWPEPIGAKNARSFVKSQDSRRL